MTQSADLNPLGARFPGDWLATKIGRITTKVGSGATPRGGARVYQEVGTPLIRSLNVHNEGFKKENLAFISDDHARQLEFVSVRANDVLLNITGASILRSAIAPPEMELSRVNQHVAILRADPSQVIPGFLHVWLVSPIMYSYMYSQSVGSTREAITKEQILRFPIILPSLREQENIIALLKSITEKIDEIIEKLSRQVELLERYRRELIARTVTRGLNPNAEMRDSVLEWLDAVPAHWEEMRISSIYDLRVEKVSDVDFPPLSVTMSGIVPQLDHVAKTNDRNNRKLVRVGDFVINSRSDRRGACGIADRDGSCSLINLVLRPKSIIHNPYFGYLLRSVKFADEFYRWGHGIHNDLWTTNWADMKSISVPVPPLDEQIEIACFLHTKMLELDSAVHGICMQIDLLSKYRKQVINDAVTGKLRLGGLS